MSWKDTYQTWLDRKDLEPSLKRQLAAMKDEKEIEDAFMVRFRSVRPACGD